jgi:hypothetical protein
MTVKRAEATMMQTIPVTTHRRAFESCPRMVSRRHVRHTFAARSWRIRLFLQVSQHGDHERQQLLQRR